MRKIWKPKSCRENPELMGDGEHGWEAPGLQWGWPGEGAHELEGSAIVSLLLVFNSVLNPNCPQLPPCPATPPKDTRVLSSHSALAV